MIVVEWLLLALGFAMLIKGSDFFVDGAAGLAAKFGIPQLVIGLTIVAMGTSAPEAAVSISSAINGSAGIAVGNVVGSNILNILLILGIVSVIVPIAVGITTIKYEIPFMIAISVVMLLIGLDGTLSRIDAIILLGLFVVYMIYLMRLAKKNKDKEPENTEENELKKKRLSVPAAIILAAIGMALIVGGSQVTVNAATNIALSFGISDRIIGLTVVAFGTSLPELFTSVTAARKGNADIAIGNIVGSNIFNILFVLGITGIIIDIPYAVNFRIDSLIAIGASVLLFFCVFKSKKLGRTGGIIMLVSYAAYFAYTLIA